MGVTRQRRNPCSMDAGNEDTGLVDNVVLAVLSLMDIV